MARHSLASTKALTFRQIASKEAIVLKPVIWRITHLVILLGLLLFPFSTKAWALSISLDDAVDNSLTWTTGGDAEWFGQTSVFYFDTDAAQSGDMPEDIGRSSWIRTTVEGPGIISFYWRVSILKMLVFF